MKIDRNQAAAQIRALTTVVDAAARKHDGLGTDVNKSDLPVDVRALVDSFAPSAHTLASDSVRQLLRDAAHDVEQADRRPLGILAKDGVLDDAELARLQKRKPATFALMNAIQARVASVRGPEGIDGAVLHATGVAAPTQVTVAVLGRDGNDHARDVDTAPVLAALNGKRTVQQAFKHHTAGWSMVHSSDRARFVGAAEALVALGVLQTG
jgi:hypothetical protein